MPKKTDVFPDDNSQEGERERGEEKMGIDNKIFSSLIEEIIEKRGVLDAPLTEEEREEQKIRRDRNDLIRTIEILMVITSEGLNQLKELSKQLGMEDKTILQLLGLEIFSMGYGNVRKAVYLTDLVAKEIQERYKKRNPEFKVEIPQSLTLDSIMKVLERKLQG